MFIKGFYSQNRDMWRQKVKKFDWKEMFKIDFWAATATAHFFAQKLGPFLSILKKVKKNIIF